MTAPKGEPPALVDQVAAEVRSLRKGRGLQAGELDQRLGPLLRELAAGGGGGRNAGQRHALISELNDCGKSLASDLRLAIQASLGLSQDTRQMPLFRDRVSFLAAEIGYEYRTALRRIDTAEQLLSEEIARELLRRRGRGATAPDGWHLDQLSTLVRLDAPAPEVHEHRRIVAARAGLSEVMAWTDVLSQPGEAGPSIAVEVMYGGRLVREEHPTGTRFQLVVQLPKPLDEGEQHEYGLQFRFQGTPMRPHYVFSPECQCNEFDLRVRYQPGRRPGWIRRVDGETVRVFDAAQPVNDLVDADEAGEVFVHFDKPTMYLCYGLQWQPPDG